MRLLVWQTRVRRFVRFDGQQGSIFCRWWGLVVPGRWRISSLCRGRRRVWGRFWEGNLRWWLCRGCQMHARGSISVSCTRLLQTVWDFSIGQHGFCNWLSSRSQVFDELGFPCFNHRSTRTKNCPFAEHLDFGSSYSEWCWGCLDSSWWRWY